MNPRLLRPALASLALTSLVGCTVQNLGAVQVAAMCYPTADCTFAATCTNSDALGAPYVDLLTTGGTLLYPFEFDNQRLNNANATSGLTNTNDAVIEKFEMSYQAAGVSLPSATSPQFVVVPAAGTTVAAVILIPEVAGTALAAALPATPTEVIVHFKAAGHYEDLSLIHI